MYKRQPFGLPILLSGGVGVGKSFLSRLVYEYGKNQGLLPRDSSYMLSLIHISAAAK